MNRYTSYTKLRRLVTIFLLSVITSFVRAQQSLDLAGTWEFQIDRDGVVTPGDNFDDFILLPGSMPQRRKGDKPSTKTVWTGSLYDSSYFHNPYMKKYQTEDNFKLPFFLTPDRHYIGLAWYRRTVTVPKEMKDRRIVLFLERPHIISTVYVDGKMVGSRNSLCVAHEYDITDYVSPGKSATIAIQVDNDYKKVGVGQDSHSVTDQTQGNWNGIVGRMELLSTPKTYIAHVDVYPDAKKKEVSARVMVVRDKQMKDKKVDLHLSYGQKYNGVDHSFFTSVTDITLAKDTTFIDVPARECWSKNHTWGIDHELWDEFNPKLCQVAVVLLDSKKHTTIDRDTVTYGLRNIETWGKDILINGRPTLMRGTVENCDFPMTGYAPMTKDEWLKVFRQCKAFGLNHMRFHSYCPPEAAFEAADEVGFYLQPEGPSWPNHGVKLGNKQIIDSYLMEETKRMVDKYGNHPSFTMMACGNEPSGNWVAWVSQFVDYWKATDNRLIYTGASVGGGWAWQPKNQYHVKAGARGLDSWNNHEPESMENFLSKIDTVSQPFISHETGQWCVFPDFDEISKYDSAVNKAKNFEIFRDILKNKGMEQMAQKFLMSSGKTQVLCYKAEIERTLRTPHYAGYQLLGLNDYSGQGSALVGPLNVFWEEKPFITSEEWNEFSGPVTVLAELPKFVYWDDEEVPIRVKVSHYGKADLKRVHLSLLAEFEGQKTYHITSTTTNIPIGLSEVLQYDYDIRLPEEKAQRVRLKAMLLTEENDTITQNHWDFYVFPKKTLTLVNEQMNKPTNEQGTMICHTLDDQALKALEEGRNVLLVAAGKVSYGEGISQKFTPVFWNTSWFKMRPPHTTGMYIDAEHPVFRNFPTEDWADMQWWIMMTRQQVMLMDDFPKDFMPIVQPIDTWFLSRKLGMLFEAKVLNGKLMMTTMPLEFVKHPSIAQMRASILEYMQSDEFRPTQSLNVQVIQDLFTKKTPDVNMFTNDNPDELKKGVR